MNVIFRAAITTTALILASPASAGMPDDPDARRVEVEGPDGEWYKLTRASYEVVVDVPPERAWAMFADYGAVENYTAAVYESDWLGVPEMGMGADRYCKILFQGRDIMVKERVFEFTEGESFKYDVYDWENFPLTRMFNTFGVYIDDAGQTVVYNVIDFKLKPAILTGVMRGQMQKSARATMLSIKHALETGEGDVPREELEALYPNA